MWSQIKCINKSAFICSNIYSSDAGSPHIFQESVTSLLHRRLYLGAWVRFCWKVTKTNLYLMRIEVKLSKWAKRLNKIEFAEVKHQVARSISKYCPSAIFV